MTKTFEIQVQDDHLQRISQVRKPVLAVAELIWNALDADADHIDVPTHTAIKLILDNHSAHISKETKAWLAEQPAGRFEFTFTPKHGSWLNLVEGFFSKLARSVLRHIRVASKQELKDRLMAAMDDINQHRVIHTWSYKLDHAA